MEEAARLLRIGRTKAYALTQEWRASGGRSGLPVIDLGSVLRVPRSAIEQLTLAALASHQVVVAERPSRPTRSAPRRTKKPVAPTTQASLFDASPSEA